MIRSCRTGPAWAACATRAGVHSRSDLSAEAETTRLPSGWKATPAAGPSCRNDFLELEVGAVDANPVVGHGDRNPLGHPLKAKRRGLRPVA